MHGFGIVFLFPAAILPPSPWPVRGFGIRTTVASIMTLPVLIYWFLLDMALGTAILGAAVILLATAAVIVNCASAAGVRSISGILIFLGMGLQTTGHRLFERRQPALLDNPSHLLPGPMFVMAKLFVAPGFRHDHAVMTEPVAQPPTRSSSRYAGEYRVEPLPHS